MCGIAGVVGTSRPGSADALHLMQETLRKRGPDDQGIWDGDNAILAHTRLSIIDVGGSLQPMANEDRTVFVTFNGEIYNFPELRRFLATRGHTLKTQGDTEVLVHLYEEFGAQMVERLDGMFAFGLYDTRRRSLLLARDRVGIKPLYYWHSPRTGEIVFASDLRAMLANPAVPRRLNKRALAQYLHFGYAIHPETWLQQVCQLEPGEILEWSDGRIRRSHFFAWRYEPRSELAAPRTALSTLQEHLTASVESQLIADVPLGSFLSGGLDSTTITGLAQQVRRRSRQSIDSFTVRFWVADLDESTRAREIARDLDTRHTEVDAQELQFDEEFIDRFLDGLGEPFGDNSALAVYVLCQQARSHVKVALAGDGGDELLFGYTGLRRQRLARRFRMAPGPMRQMVAGLTAGGQADLPRRLHKYIGLSFQDDPGLIIEWARRWDWPQLGTLLDRELLCQLFPDPEELFPEVRALIGSGPTGGFLEQQLQFHMRVDLPCDNLLKVDRMSMAHGLEVRVPLLSNAMLEFGRQMPLERRATSRRTKEPLRTLAESLSATVARPSPKRGFSFPLERWTQNKLAEHWREWGLTHVLAEVGFDAEELDRLVAAYARFDAEAEGYAFSALAVQLFDLMLLARWMQTYRISPW